jgi:uncharacterized membrane protein
MEPNSISQPKTSAAAVASLIFGIVFCIPVVSQLAAIILGFVGISKTSNPMVKGRGLAVAGLILGVLGLVGYTAGGFGIYVAYKAAMKPAEDFTKALSAGKIDEAVALTVEGTDRATLVAMSEKMKEWGEFQAISPTSFNANTVNGKAQFLIEGPVNFANAAKTYTMTLIQVGETFKVEKFDYK